jgi:hypothetical protein
MIAEKSFQYSNVIRVAPRKSIRTRARMALVELDRRISFHCRAYKRCRAAMIRLGANADILSRFQNLEKEHIKSSTAVVDPNIPGSSTLKLSWIWQSGFNTDLGSTQAVQECMCLMSFFALCSVDSF